MTSWVRTRLFRFVSVVALVAAALLAGAYIIALHFASSDRIAKGVSVSGIELGRVRRAEAERVLQSWAACQARRDVTLTALDRRWSGPLAALGLSIDWRDAASRAYAVGRTSSVLDRVISVLTSAGKGKRITARLRVDRLLMQRTLRKVAEAVNRPHTDARIRVVDSRIEIKQDSCGIKLDEEGAVSAICAGVRSDQSVIRLPVVIDRPEVTAKDCVGIDTLLSSYTTSFNRGLRGRTHNLTLAARCIDGAVLKPGQEFSVNAAVGPRLANRGFRTAQIFVRGKIEDGIGGGVCQVSSTLFNAVLLAGLAIKERSPHSQTVPYVAPGRDATVVYGLRDFRFVNSNSSAIGIVMTVSGSRLTARVYGSASDRKQVKLFTGRLTRLPGGGCRTVLYRKIVQPDGSATTDVFRSSYLPSTPATAREPSSSLASTSRQPAAESPAPGPDSIPVSRE